MPDANVMRIVLIPRYTALTGQSDFFTKPINVKRFAKVILTVWQSVGLGVAPSTARFFLQQSPDLLQWESVGSLFPSTPVGDEETTVELDIDLEWIRLQVVVYEDVKGVTLWAVGQFVERSASPPLLQGNGR